MASKNHPEFSSGRTVKARELQYIERPADAQLLDHCQNARPAFILHSPQMGKSSLIAHTAEQLNDSAHHAVLIDLSQFPLPPREEEWFHKIVRILDDSLDLTTDPVSWWDNQQDLSPPVRMTQLLTEVILPELSGSLVLFIDEIERTTNLTFREHFFEWLARLYESRGTNSILYRLSFVVCGVATPSQLIPEDWPLLFQWSHRVVLSDFTLQESLLLAEGLSLPTEAATEAVQWIYRWTNGHPYLTQLLCQLLEGQHRMAWKEEEVDECIKHFLTSPQGLREPNFQFVRTALTEPTTTGASLLEPYLDLLEGRTENLKTNPSALEQLRLVGVLREDDDNILIHNLLYQEVFPISWVKHHRPPPAPPTPIQVQEPQAPPSPPPPALTSEPAGDLEPPARQHSYVLAASLFLVGVGLLLWFFQNPVSEHRPEPAQEVTSAPLEPTLSPSDNSNLPETTLALAQAEEKIQALETTIIRYQQLSSGEVESLTDQRTQLESQLTAKDQKISDLKSQIHSLESTLTNQRNDHEAVIAEIQADRAQLQSNANSTAKELKAAQEEVKNLQIAVLKKSALSPSEINKLMADRSKLDSELKTANRELALSHERARGLEARLNQQQQFTQTERQRLIDDRTKLEAQVKAAESGLHETRGILKATETAAKEQTKLAQTELARVQQDRSAYQEQLRLAQQSLASLEARTEELTMALRKKEQSVRDVQQEKVALETQTNKLTTSLSGKDEAIQQAQQTITLLKAELEESRELESQAQSQLAQEQKAITENQKAQASTLLTLEKEKDQLTTKLSLAQQELNTTKTQMASMADQLRTIQQTAASSENALKSIHASSSEQIRRSEEEVAKLSSTYDTLQNQLQQRQNALDLANNRIKELENNLSAKAQIKIQSQQITQERDQFATQLNESHQQLAMARNRIQTLEQSLRTAKQEKTKSRSSSLSNSLKSSFPQNEALTKVVTAITNTLGQKTSPFKTESSKLLWARQAFLFSQRIGGVESASIDHSLRQGLHASPLQLKGVAGRVHSLDFDPFGDRLVAGTSKGKILTWTIRHPGRSPKTFAGHTASVGAVSVSPDGQYLASGSLDATIRLWNLSQPDSQPRILQAHTKGVTSLAFRPDGKELVSGSQDRTLRLWDLTKDQPQAIQLGQHDGRVNALAYTPNGQILLSGGDDLTLRVWDLQRPNSPPKILRGHQQAIASISIHPSGWMVATGSRDSRIGLWNLRQPLASPTFLTGSSGRIAHVQFNTDGTSLASVGSDKSLRLWNWNDPSQPPIQFPQHKGTLEAMAISPDGRTIAVGGSSQSLTLWTDTQQLAHTVCDTAKENLAFDQWKKIAGNSIPYERTCPNLPLHPSFLEEGKRLAKQGARAQAQTIFERAKQLDPFLKLDPKKEVEKLAARSS